MAVSLVDGVELRLEVVLVDAAVEVEVDVDDSWLSATVIVIRYRYSSHQNICIMRRWLANI